MAMSHSVPHQVPIHQQPLLAQPLIQLLRRFSPMSIRAVLVVILLLMGMVLSMVEMPLELIGKMWAITVHKLIS
jgi:hypothetical protein